MQVLCFVISQPFIRAVVLQGYHSGSLIVALLGIFKAVVGLLIRPLVGTMELLGKSAHGVGLLFLGREGISGTIQKRARAPGTLTDDSEEVRPLSHLKPQKVLLGTASCWHVG